MATTLTKRDTEFLEECHPYIQEIFYACARSPDCPPFKIIDGARTVAQQRENVRRGASKTMRSRHIPAKNGYSHAIDVVPLVNGKITWDWQYYHILAPHVKRIASQLGILGLEWGGDWKSFKDGPHWQLSWTRYSGNSKTADMPKLSPAMEQDLKELNASPKEVVPSNNFRKSIPMVLKHEGGFVNDPDDAGKATNMGITMATYRQYVNAKATVEELVVMKESTAIDIYKQHYWDKCRCDSLPAGVDHAVFDYAVNSGVIRAKRALQQVVSTDVDGKIGKNTLKAVRAIAPIKVIEALCEQRKEYIENRVQTGKLHKKFKKGILARIERVQTQATNMLETKEVTDNRPPFAGVASFLHGILKGK